MSRRRGGGRGAVFWENTLVSCATIGIAFGTGLIVTGLYFDDTSIIRAGIITSFVGFLGMVYSQRKIDLARDMEAYMLWLLSKRGKFMGSPKKLKKLKALHTQQMEQKAQEEKEKYLEEKSKNKKLLDAEKKYQERALALLSVQERKKRQESGEDPGDLPLKDPPPRKDFVAPPTKPSGSKYL